MKKLFAVFMAMLIVFSISVASFAAEIDNTNSSGKATASYEANSSFKVTIPTYIAPEEKGTTDSTEMYSVSASEVFIPEGNQLTVTVDYDGILTEKNGVEIPYKLYSDGAEITNGQKIIKQNAGNPYDTITFNFSAAVQEEPRYAGIYTDTVTFNILVAERVYSLEEINADEHLYAIGKTKPEYVVAKFNEDFSEATIFKNGADSDGLMKDWNSSSPSQTYPFMDHQRSLISVIVSDGVTSIGDFSFWSCYSLTSITIPESVKSIGNNAFYICESLTSVNIPEDIETISDYTFDGCVALTSITIPESVTSIGKSAFGNCKSLTSINIPEDIKTIGDYTFNGCAGLTSITIPKSVTSIGKYAFYYCSSLTSINIPDGVTSIGDNAFRHCTSLTTINIPDSVTSIGKSVFYDCKSLTSINIPDGVTSIGDDTFRQCKSLTSITIPDGVTSIGIRAFYSCSSLTSINIPDSVTSIGNDAFLSCSSLKTIYGAAGSYAEIYAKNNGYTFIPV